MSSTQHDDFEPVFVVGFPRSGTTLLATLLGGHSDLAATPETHFMGRFYRGGPDSTLDTKFSRLIFPNIVLTDRIKDLNLSHEALEEQLNKYDLRPSSLFRAMLELYAHSHGKERVLEKTPAHLPYVPALLAWYPNAKVIGIVRDGRDAVLSNMRMTWTHNNMRRHARLWKWQIGLLEKFARDYSKDFMIVSFEDLVSDPEKTIRTIDDFIGVEFQASQLDGKEGSGTVPAWESDWKDQATSAPDTGKLHEWRTVATREELWLMNSMMGRRLGKHGYPDANLKGCPANLRLRHFLLNRVYDFVYCPWVEPYFSRAKRLLEKAGVLESPGTASQVDGGEVREHGTKEDEDDD